MKIGEVSSKLGIPASTIRYYEKIGLIDAQQRVSGRREFDSRALFTLEFVRLSQSVGFSIEETKLLLQSYVDGSGPNCHWVSLAKVKQSDIRAQLSRLKQMDQLLTELLSCNCASLSKCVKKSMEKQRRGCHARN